MDSLTSDMLKTTEILDRRDHAAAVVKVPVSALGESSTNCTDHMVIWQWNDTTGWTSPEIWPHGPLPLMPSASVLQYASECFEGIKVYRGYDGHLRLFRPKMNCERMVKSSHRVGLPKPDVDTLEAILMLYAALEAHKWLPVEQTGQTLYLRPTHIGTTAALGLQKPRHSLLYVIATLLPGFSVKGNALRLITSTPLTVRAWPRGFGDTKVGANYGPTLPSHDNAVTRGFDQVLWLSGDQCYVTEAGASNFFVVWRTSNGEVELVTAGLENGIILEGITRQSVLELVRARLHQNSQWEHEGQTLAPLKVVERNFTVGEIEAAAEEGRLLEAFATGTAVSRS